MARDALKVNHKDHIHWKAKLPDLHEIVKISIG